MKAAPNVELKDQKIIVKNSYKMEVKFNTGKSYINEIFILIYSNTKHKQLTHISISVRYASLYFWHLKPDQSNDNSQEYSLHYVEE